MNNILPIDMEKLMYQYVATTDSVEIFLVKQAGNDFGKIWASYLN